MKQKIDKFLADWITDESTAEEFESDLNTLLGEVAKKAFDAGKFWGVFAPDKDFNDFMNSLRG